MQRFFCLGVAKMQVTAADGAVGVRLGGLAGRFGQVQQLENLVARGHTVHRHVEVGPNARIGKKKSAESSRMQSAPARLTRPAASSRAAMPMPSAAPP